ncbi:MAG: HD domain-containing protein [Patescibacteria group bacterium]
MALDLASEYHKNQKRSEEDAEKAGYIIHCVRTARWLLENKVTNVDLICAAILHDTLEDTTLTDKEILRSFNKSTLNFIQAVTRPRRAGETEAEKKINKPKHMERIIRSTKKVRILKTADLLDNMRSWILLSKKHKKYYKFPRWVNEAEKFYIPIAQSISLNATKEMRGILRSIKKLH